jgi:hypothetical protein
MNLAECIERVLYAGPWVELRSRRCFSGVLPRGVQGGKRVRAGFAFFAVSADQKIVFPRRTRSSWSGAIKL